MDHTISTDTVNPVRQLLDEHAIFMEALEELASVMKAVSPDAPSLTPQTLGVAQRIWHQVDEHLNTHFVKEEEVFFPAIERMFPGARVKFQFLHVDHDKLRVCFDQFTRILQDSLATGSTNRTVHRLKTLAAEMVRLFYYHIIAEDAFYFEVAQKTMTSQEAEDVYRKMHVLENRLRERIE